MGLKRISLRSFDDVSWLVTIYRITLGINYFRHSNALVRYSQPQFHPRLVFVIVRLDFRSYHLHPAVEWLPLSFANLRFMH